MGQCCSKNHPKKPIEHYDLPNKDAPINVTQQPIHSNLESLQSKKFSAVPPHGHVPTVDLDQVHVEAVTKQGLSANAASVSSEREDAPLILNNSFDLLSSKEVVVPFGEVLPDGLGTSEVSTGLSDVPRNSPSPNVTLDKVVDWATTPVLSPVCAPVTFDINTYHQPVRQSMHATAPMPQPVITNYASLTSDKLPSSQISTFKSSLHSDAALKSVQILSKFWGEEVEKVMEDTISLDKRTEAEEGKVGSLISDFEKHCPSLSESYKAEKKKKKHVHKARPTSFNSAGMRTRAQKCNSKAVLAAT